MTNRIESREPEKSPVHPEGLRVASEMLSFVGDRKLQIIQTPGDVEYRRKMMQMDRIQARLLWQIYDGKSIEDIDVTISTTISDRHPDLQWVVNQLTNMDAQSEPEIEVDEYTFNCRPSQISGLFIKSETRTDGSMAAALVGENHKSDRIWM